MGPNMRLVMKPRVTSIIQIERNKAKSLILMRLSIGHLLPAFAIGKVQKVNIAFGLSELYSQNGQNEIQFLN